MANPQNLLPGGVPGNKGGTGRPPSRVREMCRAGFEKAIPNLIKIATGKEDGDTKPGFADQTRAVDVLGKYGLGEAKVLIPEEMIPILGDWIGEWVDPEKIEDATQDLFKRLG